MQETKENHLSAIQKREMYETSVQVFRYVHIFSYPTLHFFSNLQLDLWKCKIQNIAQFSKFTVWDKLVAGIGEDVRESICTRKSDLKIEIVTITRWSQKESKNYNSKMSSSM